MVGYFGIDMSRLMRRAPSEDSDQPGYPPSLIRIFAVSMKKPRVLSYPLSTQRRLWSDWADAQADLSLHWVHIILLVLSWGGSHIDWNNNFNPFIILLQNVWIYMHSVTLDFLRNSTAHFLMKNINTLLISISSQYQDIFYINMTALKVSPKVNKWATSWQNQQNDLCAQWQLRSAWASAQSDQSLCCPHKESLGS